VVTCQMFHMHHCNPVVLTLNWWVLRDMARAFPFYLQLVNLRYLIWVYVDTSLGAQTQCQLEIVEKQLILLKSV
jgi:hypothetical protein